MKWVTRARPKTDRIACPWLIHRFIDPDAEILYVPADQVFAVAADQGGHSFDAKDATYTHRGNQCTFEVLIDDYHLGDNPALARLARIVHAADIKDDLNTDPLGPGLLAIGQGGLDVEDDDQRLLERGLFVYDALYAWCQHNTPIHSPSKGEHTTHTVLFVCPHGAGKSRLAAAWFNSDPPAGWSATTAAGEDPATQVHSGLATLLAGTAALSHLDQTPPRGPHTEPAAEIVVAIDCDIPATHRWHLRNPDIDHATSDELRHLVTQLVHATRGN